MRHIGKHLTLLHRGPPRCRFGASLKATRIHIEASLRARVPRISIVAFFHIVGSSERCNVAQFVEPRPDTIGFVCGETIKGSGRRHMPSFHAIAMRQR